MNKKLLISDLVRLGEEIYIQDCLTKVTNKKRKLNVEIEVSNVSLWEEQKEVLKELIGFMSHDNLEIKFIENRTPIIFQENFDVNNISYEASTLLSGGLDSLCGVDYNIKNNIKSVYSSYKINTFETTPIMKLKEYLKNNFNALHYTTEKIDVKKVEHTQRTRSLYFICLACKAAYENNITRIKLYENGIMSLNPGLSSRTPTRTTHPKTIKLINQLFKGLDIGIYVEHPFLFSTKGEMVNNLSNEFKKLISITNTCGMSRQNSMMEVRTGHCGACVPCLLRKISIASYNNEKYDVEYDMPYNSKVSKNKKLYPYLKSSYAYYHEFYDKIKKDQIFYELDINQKYYDDAQYLTRTKDMLEKFSNELEIFFRKYPID